MIAEPYKQSGKSQEMTISMLWTWKHRGDYIKCNKSRVCGTPRLILDPAKRNPACLGTQRDVPPCPAQDQAGRTMRPSAGCAKHTVFIACVIISLCFQIEPVFIYISLVPDQFQIIPDGFGSFQIISNHIKSNQNGLKSGSRHFHQFVSI